MLILKKSIVLIFVFFNSIIFASSELGQKQSLPPELCQNIIAYFKMESSAKIPLYKYNICDNSNDNEKLHFPTTGFIEFIQTSGLGNNPGPEELRSLRMFSIAYSHV